MKKQNIIINWLNKEFGNLTKVVRGDKTFYIDKDRLPLLFYCHDKKNGFFYVSYKRIWLLFETIFGMEYQQIQDILKIWLEETYNLRGLTPYYFQYSSYSTLEETYNLRGLTPCTDESLIYR